MTAQKIQSTHAFLLFWALTLCGFAINGHAASHLLGPEKKSKMVQVYLPAFEGQDDLGLKVATVLNLQIWQTLRASIDTNQNINFGKGKVLWSADPLQEASHIFAEHAALHFNSHFTLWGKAWEYGDGVVVQAYLSIPQPITGSPGMGPPIWSIALLTSRGLKSIAVGIPRRRYEFAPIVLRSAIVKQFREPIGMPLISNTGKKVGEIGLQYEAKRHEKDRAWVESDGKAGWLLIPALSDSRTEIVDFVGGLIRILRTDRDGALSLLDSVVTNEHAPAALRSDALLISAAAMEMNGRSGRSLIQKAALLSPQSWVVAAYSLMSSLGSIERLLQKGDVDKAASLAHSIRAELAARRYLFAGDDPWLLEVESILSIVESQ